MRNLTVTLPEPVLDRLRVLAAQRKLSVNRLVGEILTEASGPPNSEWMLEHESLLAELGSRTRQGTWSRQEIYADRLT